MANKPGSTNKEETPAWLSDNVETLSKNVASSPAAQEYAVTAAINSLSAPGGLSKLVWHSLHCEIAVIYYILMGVSICRRALSLA